MILLEKSIIPKNHGKVVIPVELDEALMSQAAMFVCFLRTVKDFNLKVFSLAPVA